MNSAGQWKRRSFLQVTAMAAGSVALTGCVTQGKAKRPGPVVRVEELPKGKAPQAVAIPHFPDRLHAYVWRNWTLVPVERMAGVVGATRSQILEIGRSMGLKTPPRITQDQIGRSYLTVIKRNWHLLPYEQILGLLGWTTEQMAFTLREDDFFYIKLGSLKPACEPLLYEKPGIGHTARVEEIKCCVTSVAKSQTGKREEPLFHFVQELSSRPETKSSGAGKRVNLFAPRFCYSYFALYGDPLLDGMSDPYPEGYLERLAECGVEGVWLQAVLYKLALFPWDPALSERHQERLANLRKLVERARRHGIGIWLYLNEPRSMPVRFFDKNPGLKGVVEGDHASLCTSHPDVQQYITQSIASICRSVPGLAGFFTITASENLTNCWSHHQGAQCPRCSKVSAASVVARVNCAIQSGIQQAELEKSPRLIAWDWGWNDAWTEEIVGLLQPEVTLMSVSEWSLPIDRGGVKSAVGEYSMSSVGPGPRAPRQWAQAKARGLRTMAKIQAGNTWELSAVPYIPVVKNVAEHIARLRKAKVGGLMLGWTLGGCPSPNLEVVAELGADPGLGPEEAMLRVANRLYGVAAGAAFVKAWNAMSDAFCEFPFSAAVVYQAPLQLGPANLLWPERTGYQASMVGFPYDALDQWRGQYPVEVFVRQMSKVATGFERAYKALLEDLKGLPGGSAKQERTIQEGLRIMHAATIHFQSVVNQCRFVELRGPLAVAAGKPVGGGIIEQLEQIIRDESRLAKELMQIQQEDSRIGFEASNQYFYVPQDLLEKQVNCQYLLQHWVAEMRAEDSEQSAGREAQGADGGRLRATE